MTIRPRRSLLNPELQRPSALNSVPRDTGCIWLDKNENLDPELNALARDVLLSIPQSALATYPEAGALYRKLGKWVGVSPESLLLTPGSDGAIRIVFESFVETADAVVRTSPTFAMYSVYAQMFGAADHQIEYQRTAAEPYLDVSRIIDTVRRVKPKLLCLPNPDSPTGTILPPIVLRELLSECEATQTVMLVDEAYYPFYPWSAVPWIENSKNLVVARTFAKAWGAAGLRIGYAVAHPATLAFLHKMRPMYEVSTLAVEFMSRMMEHAGEVAQAVARIIEGKEFFIGQMRSLGFSILRTEGNFVHVAFGSFGASIHRALANQVLYRMTFTDPSLMGYSRFSVAPLEIMARVADLIRRAVAEGGS